MTRRMFARIALSAVAVSALLVLMAAAAPKSRGGDEPKMPVTNKRCPVSGGPVNPSLRVEYKGQYVYFCCDGCPEAFTKDPEKYIPKMSPEDQAAIKINEKCPVSGDPVNKSISMEYEGKKLYFCSQVHLDQFKKEHDAKSAD